MWTHTYIWSPSSDFWISWRTSVRNKSRLSAECSLHMKKPSSSLWEAALSRPMWDLINWSWRLSDDIGSKKLTHPLKVEHDATRTESRHRWASLEDFCSVLEYSLSSFSKACSITHLAALSGIHRQQAEDTRQQDRHKGVGLNQLNRGTLHAVVSTLDAHAGQNIKSILPVFSLCWAVLKQTNKQTQKATSYYFLRILNPEWEKWEFLKNCLMVC